MKLSVLMLLALPLMAVELTVYKTNENSWNDAFEAARKASREITVPSGRIELERPLEVSDGMTLVFEDGAELATVNL